MEKEEEYQAQTKAAHVMEHGERAIEDMARLHSAYYHGLIEEGVPETVAAQLTQTFAGVTLTRSFFE